MPSIPTARVARIGLWSGIFVLSTSCAHHHLPPDPGSVGSDSTLPAPTTLAHAEQVLAPMPALEPEPEFALEPEPETVLEPEPVFEPQEDPPAPGVLWEWEGDGRRVSHIWVDVDTQKARFFDGADQIGWTTIASGRKKYPTPTGRFVVMEKISKKRSNLYGKIYNRRGRVVKSSAKQGRDRIPSGGRFVGASMPYFMRLTYDGIALHAGAIPNPGSPASHGCIRMPKDVAPVVFRHVDIGTSVSITSEAPAPDYGDYAERKGLTGL